MPSTQWLIYGANGFVGQELARLAVRRGLKPILAGRNAAALALLANELGLEMRSFDLQDAAAVDAGLSGMQAVMHFAGPYIYTYRSMVEACLRRGVHYLDITGELSVYQALAELDLSAQERRISLLPGVGFDVVPTDCLANHLLRRLPGATRLSLAFYTRGAVGLPPGTANTLLSMLPQHGRLVRHDGQLVPAGRSDFPLGREVDFGTGASSRLRRVSLLTWGDLFMAGRSTGILSIADYIALAPGMDRWLNLLFALRFMLRPAALRRLVRRFIPTGSTSQQRLRANTHVWGEATRPDGARALARLHGPESGVEWTCLCALAALERLLGGSVAPGFLTPAQAFGPDFVLEVSGAAWPGPSPIASREDLE